MRKATFPIMGHYTTALAYLASELGFDPIIPPPITAKTIKLGVRHSSEMVCHPFKSCLGSLIEGLEMGADNIIALGTTAEKYKETCRFRFYSHIHEQILRRLGYKFDIHYIRGPGWRIIKDFKRINPNLSYYKIWTIIRETYKRIKDIEAEHFKYEESDINIGIVGEAYCLWEPSANYDIIDKLRKMDVGVDISTTLSWWLTHQVGRADEKKHLYKEVKKYFPKRIGGHGYESIYNTIDYAKRGFDGVIHLLPLTCMPETLIEMVMNMISEDYGIPVYRFPIDENKFETGFDTRLETFIKLIRRKKYGRLYRD